MNEQIRLNRAMSILGICSRRDADKLISSGEVFVNDKQITEAGTKIFENEKITFQKKDYIFKKKQETKIWIYYKPIGLVTSHNDEKNRETVFNDLKSKIKERVISVGRLDLNSEGLLLLTNDSGFSRFAESPKTAWKRHYRVRIFGTLTKEIISTLKKGPKIDGIKYAPIIVKSKEEGLIISRNRWIECVLTEGKNREIRKVFAHFGLSVNRLIRTKYGPYDLENLKPGEIKRVSKI